MKQQLLKNLLFAACLIFGLTNMSAQATYTFSTGQDGWDLAWGIPGSASGTVSHDATGGETGDGALVLDRESDNSNIGLNPAGINASVVNYIRVKYKNLSLATSLRVQGSSSAGALSQKVFPITPNNNAWVTEYLDVSDITNWSGTVDNLDILVRGGFVDTTEGNIFFDEIEFFNVTPTYSEFTANPDFEDAPFLIGWTPDTKPYGYVDLTTAESHSGSQSLNFVFTGAQTNWFATNADSKVYGTPVVEGSTLDISVWVKSNVNRDYNVFIAFRSGGANLSTITKTIPQANAGDWYELTHSYTLAVGENPSEIYTRISLPPTNAFQNTEEVYIDDITSSITPPALPTLTSTVNNGAWNDPATWDGVNTPTSGYNVILANSVVINDGTSAACNNLEVNPGKLFTISDTGSLDVGGTLTIKSTSTSYGGFLLKGTVTGNTNLVYERNVNMAASGTPTGGNDLITAPVSGQAFNNFVTDNPNLKTDPGSTATLFGTYDNTTSTYATWDEAAATALVSGTGYRSGTTDGGTLSFTGTTGNIDVDVPVSNAGDAWNLIGNPFPCYINTKNFIENANNINVIDSNNFGIYGYDGDVSDGWLVINNANVNVSTYNRMTPGQGFFVKKSATAAPTDVVKFLTGMRLWGNADDYIDTNRSVNAENTNLKLQISTASKSYRTEFYFDDNASLGFDVGYDSGLFEDVAPEFSLYSHIVQNNAGINLAIQSLNSSNVNNVTIPLGVHANSGEELTISIASSTIAEGTFVYLEDSLTNTWTELNSSDYTITPLSDLSGTGRFFVHFSSTTLSLEDNLLNGLNIYTDQSSKTVVVKGQLTNDTMAIIYDMQGRLVLQQELESSNATNSINVNALNTGIYIVQLQNQSQSKTQKVIIN